MLIKLIKEIFKYIFKIALGLLITYLFYKIVMTCLNEWSKGVIDGIGK